MKKLIRVIFTLALIAVVLYAAAYCVPRLAHTCSNCDEFFIGTGYSANLISNAITSISGDADKVLCTDCAAKEHALAIAAGKELKDFRIPLFPETAEAE